MTRKNVFTNILLYLKILKYVFVFNLLFNDLHNYANGIIKRFDLPVIKKKRKE